MRVGIDVTSISRFEALVENTAFLKKNFTKNEIEYFKVRKNPSETLAGLFALKEAFLKAIGVGVLRGINLTELEITHIKSGAPELEVSDKIKKQFNIKSVSVSISHDVLSNVATAICIVE